MVQDDSGRRRLQEHGYNVRAFGQHVEAVTDEREKDYLRSLQAGFVDASSHPSAPYAPRLLYNDKAASQNVLSALEAEFQKCDRFDVSVAFVTKDGVTVLMKTLLDMERRGVPGRVLVSTYLDFNDPDALERLRGFANIELRVFEGALHSKGYLFGSSGLCTLVIGSSNLTQGALLANSEWNLLVRTYEQGAIWDATQSEFDRLWNARNTSVLDDEWLRQYRQHWKRAVARPTFHTPVTVELDEKREHAMRTSRVCPNRMQTEALANLKMLRAHGARRALLVSATGTGKTLLAAFDVASVNPPRMLFVIHRERIAREAMESFAKVVDPGRRLGLFTGGSRDDGCDYLFCTIQSLAKHLADFDPRSFQYVIFDEAHHVGAGSYQRIANHFQPEFMLGMTATPSRNDDFNVYDFFHNNIAYQITLQKAQEEDMLAPFHYFGIHDLEVDGEEIDDFADFKRLTSTARVEHVLRELERYTVDSVRRGLVFCSSIEEAHTLARLFNDRGHRSVALDGSSSDLERERAIQRLESNRKEGDDWIEFIFTRDIFNEGVDIPAVNLVVMLRPTDSAIVFVQQLGRGLRKHEGKEYVLVLDFIGNYKKSYLIPIALSGDRTYNKDNIRRFIQEGNRIIPGCSTINFDEVSQRRIYQLLDDQKFGSIRFIRNEYTALKNMLGRIPSLMDFYQNGSIDLQLLFGNTSLGSYHAFLSKYEKEYRVAFTKTQEQMLKYVSQKLASGKRVQDLLLLRLLLRNPQVPEEEYERAVHDVSPSLPVAALSVRSALDGSFLTGGQATTYARCTFLEQGSGAFRITRSFAEALANEEFCRQLLEVVEYGIFVHGERYGNNYDHTSLVLYQKYTYEDVCRLLEWRKNVSGQNIGGYKYDEDTNTFPVFINYEKEEDISDTTKYADRFVNPSRLIAISKSNRRLDSKDIVRLRMADEVGMRVYLFVRKNKSDAESKEFYYLGEMRPTGEFKQIMMPVEGKRPKPAVEIVYDLLTPVKDELYDYLTSGEG
ncbi:MAG: DEAD/DEAH box helicase [Coriobacteriales bacterium]|nr:DEAD/DEAH box helicase [Coriobacteriales bacterium]